MTSWLRYRFLLTCVYGVLLFLGTCFASPWRRTDVRKMLDAMPLNDFSAPPQEMKWLTHPQDTSRSFCSGPRGQPFIEGQRYPTPRQHPVPPLGLPSLYNQSSCTTYKSRFGQYDDAALAVDRTGLDWQTAMAQCRQSWRDHDSSLRSAFVIQADQHKRWVSHQAHNHPTAER